MPLIEQTDLKLGTGSVREVSPDTSFGSVEDVQTLQRAFPEFRGIDPYNLKKRLVTDNEFFNDVSERFFQSGNPQQIAQFRQENPEEYEHTLNTFKNNLRKRLTRTSYAGEDVKQTLSNRSIQTTRRTGQIPIEDYKRIIEQNPDRYRDFGILDESNRISFGEDTESNVALSQMIFEDESLHQRLSLDFYKEFENELAKRHNQASLFRDNKAALTQAYVTYKHFGPEGLTQLTNAIAFGDADESVAGAFQKGREAQEWLANAQVDGVSLPTLINEFTIGNAVQDVKYADLINQYAYDHGISPSLMAGLFRQESSFNPSAIGGAGEIGLGQFMAATAAENGLRVPQELVDIDKRRMQARGDERRELTELLRRRTKELSTPENDDRFNPEKSIEATARLLGRNMQEFDYDSTKALAAYNAGAGRVRSAIRQANEVGGEWTEFIPDSTRNTYIPLIDKYSEEYGATEPLVFQPIEARADLSVDVPKDYNAFSSLAYDGVDTVEDRTLNRNFFERFIGDEYRQFMDEGNIDRFGQYSDELKQVAWGIFESAVHKQDGFDLEDLTSTVLANASHQQKDGRDVWTFNYEDLPTHARLAVEALHLDPQMGDMFRPTATEGVFEFIPDRHQEAWDWWKNIRNAVSPTRTVGRRQPDGSTTFEEVPADGILNSAIRTVTGAGLALGHTLYKFAYEPAVRATAYAMGQAPGLEYADDVRVRAQTSIFDVLTGDDEIGSGNMGVAMAGDMIQYMGAMFVGGRGMIAGGGKALSAITGTKKTTDFVNYGNQMFGSPRVSGAALKLSNAVATKKPWATGFGVFYSGGALVEATQPQQLSFFNLIPEVLGYEPTNDVRKMYQMANTQTKVGMDIAASLMLDGLADNLVSMLKFGTAKSAQRFWGRDKFKGLTYNPQKFGDTFGGYEVRSTPQYRTDFGEFWHNITRGLDELPMGRIGDDFVDVYVPKGQYATVNQFVRSFVDETGDVATNIKRDIEDHVTWINRNLGDEIMDDATIRNLVEENYNHFIDAASERIHSVLREGSDQLPLRFADSLEQVPARVREFRPQGESISVSEFHRYKSKGHNIFVKQGKVFEVEPDFWTVDLANAVRAKATKGDRDRVFRRKVSEQGLDRDNLSESALRQRKELMAEVDNTVGASVRVQDGRIGYVTDFDDVSYRVRLEDGTQVQSRTVSQIPDDQLRQMELEAANINRQRELDSQVPLLPPASAQALNPSGQALSRSIDNLNRLPQLQQELSTVHSQIRQASVAMRNLSRRYTQQGQMMPEDLQARFDGVRQNLRDRRQTLMDELGEIRGDAYEPVLRGMIQSLDGEIGLLRQMYRNAESVDIGTDAGRRARILNRQNQLQNEFEELTNQRRSLQRDLSRYYRDFAEDIPEGNANMKRYIDQNFNRFLQQQSVQRYQEKFRDAAMKSYQLSRTRNQTPFC